MTFKCCKRVYNKLVFTGSPSDGVKVPKVVSSVELKSPAVTPDNVSSEEQQHLDEKNKGKPRISGSAFDPGTKPDFFYIRLCHLYVLNCWECLGSSKFWSMDHQLLGKAHFILYIQ